MQVGSNGGERPASPTENQDWNGKPTSGQGSDAALERLKRDERLKRTWRDIGRRNADERDGDGGHGI